MGKKSLIKGGVVGVVLGAIGGVLFAPKSGKETRQDIKDAAAKANKEAEKRLKQVHGELLEKADEAKHLAEEYSGKAKVEFDELMQRAEFTKKKISELISDVRDFKAEESDVDAAVKEGEEVVADIKKTQAAKKK